MPPAAPPPLNPHVARVAEALAAERMEVMLEPIHALAEGRARHFEVSLRLLTADGTVLEQADFARLTQGSGLMPQIDCVRLVRAARVAKKLGDRGRQGSVLTTITVDSLADEAFLDTAAAEPGNGAMRLVLSFTQNEVRAFSPGHMQALAAMTAGGFSYALDQVGDLDMDFGALKAMGFAFVKLDAPVFLDGLSLPATKPAAIFCTLARAWPDP